jgi:hypothetical protein
VSYGYHDKLASIFTAILELEKAETRPTMVEVCDRATNFSSYTSGSLLKFWKTELTPEQRRVLMLNGSYNRHFR